jgi:hypothetical protein
MAWATPDALGFTKSKGEMPNQPTFHHGNFSKKILNNKPGQPGQTLGHWRKRGAMREVRRNMRGTA